MRNKQWRGCARSIPGFACRISKTGSRFAAQNISLSGRTACGRQDCLSEANVRFCAGFSDAEMLGPPHARTVGVGEAPRHEVAVIGAGGCNGRYGDLIGAQALIVGSRSPRTFTRTRYRHAGLWERGCASLRSGDLRRRSGAFGQVGSLPAQDQRIGAAKLRAGSRVCLMTCRS